MNPLVRQGSLGPLEISRSGMRVVGTLLGILLLILGARCSGGGPVSQEDRYGAEEAAARFVIAFHWATLAGARPLDSGFMIVRVDGERGRLVELDEPVIDKIRAFYPRILPYSAKAIDKSRTGSSEERRKKPRREWPVLIVIESVRRIDLGTYAVHCRWNWGIRGGGALRLVVKGLGDSKMVTDAKLEKVF